jgi:uncharacterized membrane protein
MNSARTPLATFLAGLAALLPLMLTLAVIAWILDVLYRFIGPGSVVGGILSTLGLAFVTDKYVAYAVGIVLLMAGIYALGLLVRSRAKAIIQFLLDRMLRPLPVIGNLYDVMDRFVSVFTRKQETDYRAMSPVWCYFGGEGGTAVLALLPNPEPVILSGNKYHVVLIPTAPVPIGGALIYVPVEWVKPADFGIEAFTGVYVSMGISPTPATPSQEA